MAQNCEKRHIRFAAGISGKRKKSASRLAFHLNLRQLFVVPDENAMVAIPHAVYFERLHDFHDSRG